MAPPRIFPASTRSLETTRTGEASTIAPRVRRQSNAANLRSNCAPVSMEMLGRRAEAQGLTTVDDLQAAPEEISARLAEASKSTKTLNIRARIREMENNPGKHAPLEIAKEKFKLESQVQNATKAVTLQQVYAVINQDKDAAPILPPLHDHPFEGTSAQQQAHRLAAKHAQYREVMNDDMIDAPTRTFVENAFKLFRKSVQLFEQQVHFTKDAARVNATVAKEVLELAKKNLPRDDEESFDLIQRLEKNVETRTKNANSATNTEATITAVTDHILHAEHMAENTEWAESWTATAAQAAEAINQSAKSAIHFGLAKGYIDQHSRNQNYDPFTTAQISGHVLSAAHLFDNNVLDPLDRMGLDQAARRSLAIVPVPSKKVYPAIPAYSTRGGEPFKRQEADLSDNAVALTVKRKRFDDAKNRDKAQSGPGDNEAFGSFMLGNALVRAVPYVVELKRRLDNNESIQQAMEAALPWILDSKYRVAASAVGGFIMGGGQARLRLNQKVDGFHTHTIKTARPWERELAKLKDEAIHLCKSAANDPDELKTTLDQYLSVSEALHLAEFEPSAGGILMSAGSVSVGDGTRMLKMPEIYSSAVSGPPLSFKQGKQDVIEGLKKTFNVFDKEVLMEYESRAQGGATGALAAQGLARLNAKILLDSSPLGNAGKALFTVGTAAESYLTLWPFFPSFGAASDAKTLRAEKQRELKDKSEKMPAAQLARMQAAKENIVNPGRPGLQHGTASETCARQVENLYHRARGLFQLIPGLAALGVDLIHDVTVTRLVNKAKQMTEKKERASDVEQGGGTARTALSTRTTSTQELLTMRGALPFSDSTQELLMGRALPFSESMQKLIMGGALPFPNDIGEGPSGRTARQAAEDSSVRRAAESPSPPPSEEEGTKMEPLRCQEQVDRGKEPAPQ